MKNHLKKPALLVVSITLLGSLPSLAAQSLKTFDVFKNKVTFVLPDEWQDINKEVGVPLKLLGPMHEEVRPVITLTPIDLKGESIVLDDAKEAELSYKTSRLAWLQKFNGSALNFDSLQVYKKNNNSYHQFGLSYVFNGVNYSEKSIYVECNKKTFHLKTLVKLEHSKKWNDEITAITDSFQCK